MNKFQHFWSCMFDDKLSKVIIHDTDADGYPAAIALSKYIEKHNEFYGLPESKVMLIPISHGKSYNAVDLIDLTKDYDIVVILDLETELNRTLIELNDRSREFFVIDHHPASGWSAHFSTSSTIGYVSRMITEHYDEVDYENAFVKFCHYLNSYDIWLFESSDDEYNAKAMVAYFNAYQQGFINTFTELCEDSFYNQENSADILRMKYIDVLWDITNKYGVNDELIDRIVKKNTAIFTRDFGDLGRKRFAYTFSTVHPNEIAEQAIAKYGVDFAVVSYIKNSEKGPLIKLAFRSNDEHIGVTEFANYFNGGGHRNSASAELSMDGFIVFLNKLQTE